ncbi:hypothetical protein PF010_g32952 [Phytophthora fragariae]|uniref:Uncharacterized protein n=1 Tax=Phytophthora fragariae TaxID=53985 RepID=A0A6G0JDJ1_9STRA|nr:hypothetical protein PF010_g32952 [Phytophthora fragariae]
MAAAGMGNSSTASIAAAGTASAARQTFTASTATAAWRDGEHGGGTGDRRVAFR